MNKRNLLLLFAALSLNAAVFADDEEIKIPENTIVAENSEEEITIPENSFATDTTEDAPEEVPTTDQPALVG